MASNDRIEKQVFLRAPQERVWRAITDTKEFGNWFGVAFDGPFQTGTELRGRVTPTKADPEIAKLQEPYVGAPFTVYVDRIEPMNVFAYRWHPYAMDPAVDYSSEPMTLVTFTLEPKDDGTLLTVTETGFDGIPLARRADAFEANDEGWAMQVQMIEKYLLLPQS